jgi:hypothetical protein
VLHGEELAGPAEAGLDLVSDQHDAVLVAELPQRLHQFARRNVKAALTQHWLNDDCRNALGLDICLEQELDGLERALDRDLSLTVNSGVMPWCGTGNGT